MKKIGKYLLVTAVLLAFEFTALGIMNGSTSNNIENIKGGIADDYYKIEASWSKLLSDTWHSAGGKVLIILGLILAFGPAAAAFVFDGSNSKHGGPYSMWITAALSLFLLIISMSAKFGSSDYQSNVCPAEYEIIKDNPDQIFPRVDKALNCK